VAITDIEFIREFRRNWRVLLVACTCFVFAFSAPAFLMPFLYPEVIREFGWSREQAVILASYKYVTGSIVAIVVGRFLDIIGVRRVLIAVSTLGGLALLSFLWTPGLSAYYMAGIMLGFSGSGTMVAIKVLISRAFHLSQGTAMGIAMLGTSIGGFIVPFAATYLMEAYGWRTGSALLSAGIWLIAMPLMIFFLTDQSFEDHAADAEKPKAVRFDWAIARIFLVNHRFWLIFFAVFAVGFVDQAFIQHQVLYLREDLGLGATLVASAVGMISLLGLAGRPLVGALFDGLSTRGVALSYTVLAAACVLALGALNPALLAMFVVFRAVGHSAVLLDTLVLAKHTFGLRNIGVLIGIYTAAVNLGFAVGPPVVARLQSITGSYTVPFLVCAAIAVFAAAALLPIRPFLWLAKHEGTSRSTSASIAG
jgi:MFS family permease